MPSSALKAKQLLGILSCEPPNSDLHNFIGNFAYQPVAGAPSLNAQGCRSVLASPERLSTLYLDWICVLPFVQGATGQGGRPQHYHTLPFRRPLSSSTEAL